VQHGAGVAHQQQAGGGDRHASPAAVQQRRSDGGFHLTDAGAGGGQCEVDLAGAVGDAARVDNVGEQFQVEQVEAE